MNVRAVTILGLLLLAPASHAEAQLQQGIITGRVVGPDGVAVTRAQVTLLDQLGNTVTSVVATDGEFRIANVPTGSYSLRAEAPPFLALVRNLTVNDALPIRLELRVSAALAEQVNVTAESEQPVTTATMTTLAGDAVRRAPIRITSRGLQDAVATTPGFATEDNGLLHARGVDDGFLYVVDGVPLYERMDSLHGVSLDLEMVESVNVRVGHVPPEFGFKSGGVIEVRTSSHKGDAWLGNVQSLFGTDATRQGSWVFGGPLSTATALTVGVSAQRSDRFLDPVHPDNLHNNGGALNGTAEFGWQLSPTSTLAVVGGFGRSKFDVPHTDEQEEAGQDQRQQHFQTWQTASWQRVLSSDTVSQVAGYHRSGSVTLFPSAGDTPLFIDADRQLHRIGGLGSLTHHRGRHVFKAGFELSRLSLDERFSFHVTDRNEGEETGLSEAALDFDRSNPFSFSGTATPSLMAVYAQDSIKFDGGLTVDVGIRADRANMLGVRSQWSPRVGVAYHIPERNTVVRASLDRFFQPPQAENLLLGSSEEARALSPFVDETGSGGERVEPERQWAAEIGINHELEQGVRLDVAYWRRRVRHVGDPNVLFGTTFIIPNAIARGKADGLDVRVDLPRRRGVAAYVSYTASRVVQYGPVTGGLFLEEEVLEIADGTEFTPDHDQRHVAAFGATYDHPASAGWLSFSGRYESGTPLEVDEDDLDELMARPGAELVNFEAGRVKPRRILDVAGGVRLFRVGPHEIGMRVALLNLTGARFAYNFGNFFSGTHFGPGRTFQAGVQVRLRKP